MSENNRIEYKRELTADLEKEVVAFLNSREGGHIYIGIDNSGAVYDLTDSDSVQLKIKDRLKNNIKPSCMGLFDVVEETAQGKEIIKIIVASGSEKPYYIAKKGMSEKGCFIRVGSAAEPMPVKIIEEYFSKRTRNSIGNIISRKQDLSFEQLKIYYEAQGLTLNENFAQNLELLAENNKYNYVAYLLSDRNGMSIKLAKYAGTDRVDLIENNEYGYCSLVKATKSILDKLEVENKTSAKITPKQRIERRMWDSVAIREAVVNAIVHNDYSTEVPPKFEIFSDRLEITSYGSLPEGMTQNDFFKGVFIPRNKELMRIFRDLELVEHLGSGVPRILQSYTRDSFIFLDNFIRMVFYFNTPLYNENSEEFRKDFGKNSEGFRENLSPMLIEVLKLIEQKPDITAVKMAEILNKSSRTIENYIKKLKDMKIIERKGAKLGGYWNIVINTDTKKEKNE